MFLKSGIVAAALMSIFIGADAFAEKSDQSEKSLVWSFDEAVGYSFKVIEFNSPVNKDQQCIAVMRAGISGSPMACFPLPGAGIMFRDMTVKETVVYSKSDAELSVLEFTPRRANHMTCSFTAGFTENEHFIGNLQCVPK